MMAITDELTTLQNRRGFLLLAEGARHAAPRHGPHGLLLFLDLDGLKAVNDTLGHEAGDAMLVAVADVLRSTFREGDIMARIGGDEFAVYVPSTSDEGSSVLARIEAAAAERNARADLPAWLEVSVGLTPVDPMRRESLDTLLARADAAMYKRKQARKKDGKPAA